MGIDWQRIVDNFYRGSEVATASRRVVVRCTGVGTGLRPPAAKALLAEGMAEEGITSIDTKLQFREAVRGYLPDPPQIATEIQTQLKDNLGINASLDLQESGTYLDNHAAGALDGIFLLGWGADYPDATNFLDYHFGAGSGKKFGTPFDDIVAALNTAGQTADDAAREAGYTEANNLIKQHVPAVIVAHGGSGTVFKADVEGAHSSPLSTEIFSVMKAGDRDTLVWMQNAEPLSLYCGDETDGETLRACEQIKESLYAYKVAGTDVEPRSPSAARGPDDLDSNCARRDLPRWRDARRQRRRAQLRRPVGRGAPAPRRPDGGLRVLPGPVRRLPQPAQARLVTRRPASITGAPSGRPRSSILGTTPDPIPYGPRRSP
jgi:hypothetical protein